MIRLPDRPITGYDTLMNARFLRSVRRDIHVRNVIGRLVTSAVMSYVALGFIVHGGIEIIGYVVRLCRVFH